MMMRRVVVSLSLLSRLREQRVERGRAADARVLQHVEDDVAERGRGELLLAEVADLQRDGARHGTQRRVSSGSIAGRRLRPHDDS